MTKSPKAKAVKPVRAFRYWSIACAERDGDPFFCDFAVKGYPVPFFDKRVHAETYMKTKSQVWAKGWKIVRVRVLITILPKGRKP